MKINEFKKTEQLKLIEAKFVRGRRLLDSMCEGLDADQRRIVEGVYASAIPLMKETVIAEAAMTADQIAQLFGNAEKAATASGSNRTALGKGKDVIAAADKMIKDAGRWLQDTKPVQGFDAKYEQAKQSIKGKLGQSAAGQQVLKSVQALGDYAKANPKKTAFAIGILTALAAVAGGPIGGAIAGQVLRGSMELIKGEKLSTALGKGAYTAVKGFLAGKAIEFINDNVVGQIASSGEQGIADMEAAFNKANFDDAVAGLDPSIQEAIPDLKGAVNFQMSGNVNAFRFSYNMTMTADQVEQYRALKDAVSSAESVSGSAFSPEALAKTAELHDYLSGLQNSEATQNLSIAAQALKEIPTNELTDANLQALFVAKSDLADTLDTIKSWGEGSAAAVQGAVTAIDSNAKEHESEIDSTPKAEEPEDDGEGTSYVKSNTESVEMSEAQIRQVFVGVSYLTESRLDELDFGAIKAQAAKIAQQGMAKAAEVGKNMTTRVTTSKLNKAWEKAGKPTDSVDIMKILQDNGVAAEVATQAFKDTGVEAPPPVEKANVNVKALFDFIKTLPEKEMGEIKQLVTSRQQELATA